MDALARRAVRGSLIRLLSPEERETYFTSTERGRIAYEVLAHTAFGERSKGEVGIDRLVKEGVFTAAYPLHEVLDPHTLAFRCFNWTVARADALCASSLFQTDQDMLR